MSDKITHSDLVNRAGKWLKANGCTIVFTELVTYADETPDAIGWVHYQSVMIECKASLADFRRDKHKLPRRMPHYQMGNYRFYMAPVFMIDPDDLPHGWGLLEIQNDKVIVTRRAAGWGIYQECTLTLHRGGLLNERKMMYSALRRLSVDGALKEKKWSA